MVAVLADDSRSFTARPALRSLSTGPAPTRPAPTRSVPTRSISARPAAVAGRRPRPVPAEVYRRRRILAAGFLLLSVAAVVVGARSLFAGTGGGPLSTTGAASRPALSPARSAVWVVQPGDTLWSIAHSVQPTGDERPLVDRLAAEVHGDLYPGEVVPLPIG